MRADRFSRLREDLAVYRAMTAHADAIAWCTECEVHQAPRTGGLCPVCAPDSDDAAA